MQRGTVRIIGAMNITYLIGNGFDVNIGLKSSYADFYKAYVGINSEDEPEVIKRFKEGINNYIYNESGKDNLLTIDWRDLEIAMGQFTEQMDEKEAEILYLDINDKLKEYLKKEFMFFDAEAYNPNDFYSQLTNPVSSHFNRVTINDIKKYYLSYSSEEYYNVINFNYTSTIEKLARFNGKRLPIGISFSGKQAYLNAVYHIHQRLQDDEILIGVNDVSQIANKKFHDNRLLCNMYVKPNTNAILGSGINQDCENIISNTNLFVVFGTSAGITDQRWWNLVCKKIINTNTRLLYFVHQAKKIPHQNLYIEEMKREEISKLFEHAGVDIGSDIENVINKCYVSFSDTMFKMPVTYNGRIQPEKTYKIGNSTVMLKVLEMAMKHIAVSVEATDEEAGVPSEDMWLKEFFPRYTHNSQHLLIHKIDEKEIPFDIIPIQNDENRKDIYFEVSSFFGKSKNGFLLKPLKSDIKLKALKEVIKGE